MNVAPYIPQRPNIYTHIHVGVELKKKRKSGKSNIQLKQD